MDATPPRATVLLSAVLVVAFAVSGSVLVLHATSRSGALVTADGQAYLGAAENIAAGKGVTTPFAFYTGRYTPQEQLRFGDRVPLTHFPPLYPAVLAALSKTGVSPADGTRWLNALLVGLNVVLAGLLVAAVTDAAAVGAVVGAVAFLFFAGTASGLAFSGSFVGSDVFMLSLFLAGLLVLAKTCARWSSRSFAALLVIVAAASAVRFAGVALGIAAGIVVAAWAALPARRRVIAGAGALAAGAVPLVVQSLWARAAGAEATRPLFLHVQGGLRRHAAEVVAEWFFPGTWRGDAWNTWLEAAIALVLLAFALRVRRTERPPELRGEERTILIRAVAVLAATYFVTVFASRALVDASIPIDARILGPLLFLVVLLLVALAYRIARTRLAPASAGIAVLVVAVVVAVPHRNATTDLVRHPFPKPPVPPATAVLRSLPAGTRLASNDPGTLWQVSGRTALLLPPVRYPELRRSNDRWRCETVEVGRLLAERRGYVAFGSTLAGQPSRAFVQTVLTLGSPRPAAPFTLYRVTGVVPAARAACGSGG